MKLIPGGLIAIGLWALGLWWFLGVEKISRTESQSSATAVFDFPITWNGEQARTINPNEYRLKIDGDVVNQLELKLEDLYAMTGVQKTVTIRCTEGWSADVAWEGVPLSHLLERAGPLLKNIAHVTIRGVTGYSTTLNSDEVASLDSMIALKVGGVPLTIDHGFPARLVAPTRPGLDWVKYVATITCTSN